MTLPAMTASNSLSSSKSYRGVESAPQPTGIAPAFDLKNCISGCAPAAIGCIGECGTNLSCWLRCGGSAAVTCLLACL